MIKICPDPQCEAVYHNCDKKDTRCLDCGGWIKTIDFKTYLKKFCKNWFQYDRKTGLYFRPKTEKQLELNL